MYGVSDSTPEYLDKVEDQIEIGEEFKTEPTEKTAENHSAKIGKLV